MHLSASHRLSHAPTRMLAAIIAVCSCWSALPATAGTFVLQATGPSAYLEATDGASLTVTIAPPASGENFYIAGEVQGQCGNPAKWYAFNGTDWQEWKGQELPPVALQGRTTLALLTKTDLSFSPRIDFYAGSGRNQADLLQRQHYENFHTYVGLTAPCLPPL